MHVKPAIWADDTGAVSVTAFMVAPKRGPGNRYPGAWFRAFRNQNLPWQPSILLVTSDAIAKSAAILMPKP